MQPPKLYWFESLPNGIEFFIGTKKYTKVHHVVRGFVWEFKYNALSEDGDYKYFKKTELVECPSM